MLIIFNYDLLSNESINYILKFAWVKLFLDFTIISVNRGRERDHCDAQIFYYNPFIQSYHNDCFFQTTHIFPDKVIDVHGYALKVPFFNVPPFLMTSYRNSSELTGTAYSLIQFIVQVYNFTLDVTTHYKNFDDIRKPLLVKYNALTARFHLRRNKVDVIPFQFFLNFLVLDYNENEVYSNMINFDNCILITPIAYEPQPGINIEILITFICSVSMIILLVYFFRKFARFLEIPNELSSFIIIKILLNQPIKNQPQSISEKCLMFYFIIICMSYFSNLHAELTELKMVKREISFQSFEDIDKSNMKIQLSAGLYQLVLTHMKSKNAFSKLTVVNNIEDCVKHIMNGEQMICFTTEMRIRRLLQDYKQFRNSVKIRIINFEFLNAAKTYIFSNNFLFLDKFEKLFKKIYESGISGAWHIQQNYSTSLFNNSKEWIEEDTSYLGTQLLLIIQMGCGLSLIVFLIELLLRFYKNNAQRINIISSIKYKLNLWFSS